MSADITPYLDLVPSANDTQPNFLASLAALVQGHADITALQLLIPALYDLDTAVGEQLDVVGQWIGISRQLLLPITDVYFSFNIEGLGFNQGTWQGQFDPTSQLDLLPDDAYRTLLRAKIAANKWTGSRPDAQDIWRALFYPDFSLEITDNQDMSMGLRLVGGAQPDAVTSALFKGGYLDLKPVGVGVDLRVIVVIPIPRPGHLTLHGSAPIVISTNILPTLNALWIWDGTFVGANAPAQNTGAVIPMTLGGAFTVANVLRAKSP